MDQMQQACKDLKDLALAEEAEKVKVQKAEKIKARMLEEIEKEKADAKLLEEFEKERAEQKARAIAKEKDEALLKSIASFPKKDDVKKPEVKKMDDLKRKDLLVNVLIVAVIILAVLTSFLIYGNVTKAAVAKTAPVATATSIPAIVVLEPTAVTATAIATEVVVAAVTVAPAATIVPTMLPLHRIIVENNSNQKVKVYFWEGKGGQEILDSNRKIANENLMPGDTAEIQVVLNQKDGEMVSNEKVQIVFESDKKGKCLSDIYNIRFKDDKASVDTILVVPEVIKTANK